MKKHAVGSIIAPLFKMLEAAFDLIVPLIVAKIIDVGIANGDRGYIMSQFALLAVMAVLGLACSVVAQYFAAKVAISSATGLRRDVLLKIQSLSVKDTEAVGSATLITRMTNDINQIQNGLNMFLRLFMRSPFIVFGAVIAAFFINKTAALIFTVAIIVLFIIVFGVMRISNKKYKTVQKDLDTVTAVTGETLRGVRVIRAFSREDEQHSKTVGAVEKLKSAQIAAGKISSLLNPMTYVIVNTVIVLVLWYGANGVDGGVMLSGNIIALINYISQILVELVKLANLVTLLSRSVVCAGRVGQLLDTPCSMVYGEQSKPCGETAVEFKNVDFGYNDGKTVLSGVDFSVRRGSTVGVIGGTGSGKTTLVNLIMRFYDATHGSVYLFGRPIEEYSEEFVKKTVTVVGQKNFLFAGTVKSNLLLANPNADDAELWQALETAQAAEFVREKSGGLDAVVEQGGANLSGGQRQRLCIARALLSGSEILILDDSFSALDFATDAALRKALKALPESITVFIVSQRVGSIADADSIIVLDDGKLAANGTHGELLSCCEVYREIYESQTAADDIAKGATV